MERRRQLLTPREREIVTLLIKDMSNIDIAKNLGTTPNVISVRLCRIYIKFGVTKLSNPRKLLK